MNYEDRIAALEAEVAALNRDLVNRRRRIRQYILVFKTLTAMMETELASLPGGREAHGGAVGDQDDLAHLIAQLGIEPDGFLDG